MYVLFNPASAFLKEKRALTCGLGGVLKSAQCNFKNYQFCRRRADFFT